MRRFSWILIVGLLAAVSTGAGRSAAGRQADERRIEGELDRLNRRVQELQQGAERAGAGTRQEVERQLQALEEKTAAARRRLAELRESSGDQWDAFRRGLDRTIRELRRGARRLQKSLQREKPAGS